MATRIDALREYFSLRETARASEAIPEEKRAPLRTSLRLAQQKREAAEALWLVGSPAEALKLAADAFEATAAAAAELAATGTIQERIAKGRAALAEVAVPSFDADVTQAHDQLFRELLAVHDEAHRSVAPAAMSKQEVRETRTRRLATAVAFVVAFVVAVVWLVHTPKVLRAEASASYGAQYPVSAAVDGDPKTEWLLPNQSLGWIEVQVLPARPLQKLRLLNAKNPPYNDRATLAFHVDAYSKGRVVKSVDDKFEGFSSENVWREVPLGGTDAIDKIRIEVKGYYLAGAGFGEIEVQ